MLMHRGSSRLVNVLIAENGLMGAPIFDSLELTSFMLSGVKEAEYTVPDICLPSSGWLVTIPILLI
jgi:hypothetical protein